MEGHDDEHPGAAPRRVWQVVHVVATITVPWLLAAYYWGSQPPSITGEAQLVAEFHTMAAIAAGVLLFSAVLLRFFFGRSTAATAPFAVMWVIALAYSTFQIQEYGDQFRCEAELCMPGFELFLTAVPFAIAVTLAVIGSAAISIATRRANALERD